MHKRGKIFYNLYCCASRCGKSVILNEQELISSMATKTPGERPRKTSSPKKSVTKQPTPINSRQSAVLENIPATSTQPGIEEEIRRRAYELYEERGRLHGFEQEDWARAEAEIRNKYQRGKSA
jgi:hypothetical protein